MAIDILMFECSGMKDGEKFPIVHTGRGQDVSPEFCLKNLSSHAKTLAITLEDIKHPLFKNFTHWLIYNIPAKEQINGSNSRWKNCSRFRGCQTGNGVWLV